MLKGHVPTISNIAGRMSHRSMVISPSTGQGCEITNYLARGEPWHDEAMGQGVAAAALTLTSVVFQDHAIGNVAAVGVSLEVPAGQSVALFSRPSAIAIDLLDVIAGLRRPSSGEILVDD